MQHDVKADAGQARELHESMNVSFGRSFVGVFAFLLVSLAFGVWIMQKSINAYVLQTYHKPSLLGLIDQAWWQKGADVGDALYAWHDKLAGDVGQFNQQIVDEFNARHAFTPEYQAMMRQKQQEEQAALLQRQQERSQAVIADAKQAELVRSLTVNKTQKVFFAGDSMMQGIAPHIQKHLQNLGIDSINLSKQSTGLSYPSFFDWNSTIKNTISADGSIKVLIVMLGPNDPWDMPAKGGKYLKFGSDDWNLEYQSRMRDIIDFAKAHGVGVIWVTPPNMKKDKLNEQMIHLNDVMMAELERHNIQIIDARPIMGGRNNHYNDYLEKDGKNIKMRSADGIHFSPDGQKILAKEVQSYLTIE